MSLLFQHAFYVGNALNGILYGELLPHKMHCDGLSGHQILGVELMLFNITMQTMARKRRSRRARSDILLVCFSCAALLLNTAYITTEFVFGQEMWIVHAQQPGGQEAYLRDYASVWYQTLGTSASILLNLLAHALLVRSSLRRAYNRAERYRYTDVSSSGAISGPSSCRVFYT